AFVLVRIETVEPGRCLPVDPANLVSRGILTDAPEVRPLAQLPGRDLSEPRARAPRLELRPTEVFHRRRDDETRVRRKDGIRGPGARERPDGEQTRPRGWEERAQCEDDDRRQGQEDDLPASEREACDQEPEGRRGEAARQRRAHLTAPSARGPDPGRPQGPPKSAHLGSTDPASG